MKIRYFIWFWAFTFSGFQTLAGNNVIFFHPDGMSVAHWTLARWMTKGPDGKSHWDTLPHMAIYKGHVLDSLTATSNAGATIHAYGVKAQARSFGRIQNKKIISASGFKGSLLHEAQARKLATGLIQTGHITEPGTAVFATNSSSRNNYDEITEGVIRSGTDLILSGGEKNMLPEGMKGRFGKGVRKDKKNLIKLAQDLGYHIVYTKKELQNLSPQHKKVLGIFAHDHTFHNEKQSLMIAKPPYIKTAPSVRNMTDYALKFFKAKNKNFFLVIEEEATDNFSNLNNAKGLVESVKRADETVGVLKKFVSQNPNTLVMTASDSIGGGIALLGALVSHKKIPSPIKSFKPISKKHRKLFKIGGELKKDGNVYPLITKPDKRGKSHPFVILWATSLDTSGGVVAKALGKNSHLVNSLIDNTDIFKIMHKTLFEKEKAKKK